MRASNNGQDLMSGSANGERTLSNLDLCYSRCFHPTLPLLSPVNVDLNELHVLPNSMPKTVLIPDAVGEKSIRVELLHVFRCIPAYVFDVAVVGKRRWIYPSFALRPRVRGTRGMGVRVKGGNRG